MKHILANLNFLLIVPIVSLVLFSCSEEILPSQDGKETAIIYATLDAKDSIHYVKITKAFFGGGNSEELALIPDSSYFDKVDATVKEYIGGSLTRTFTLQDTIIPNKESGAFYGPEQKVYYFTTTSSAPLNSSGAVYKLEVKINGGEFVVTGQTTLVGGMTISKPSDFQEYKFDKNLTTGVFSQTSLTINSGTAKKVEVKLYLEFDEYVDAAIKYSKSVEWRVSNVDADELINDNMTLNSYAEGETFYTLIKDNVTNDPQINKRQFKGIKMLINGASSDFQKYLSVNKPSSSLAQNKPSYTNLTASNGHRVIGIFASRFHEEKYKVLYIDISTQKCLNENSMRQLCAGEITGNLLFCSPIPSDSDEPYFCD
ncbi:MAG: hypothetical protein V4622_04425 [Bacteroidota bacterium]